MGWSGGNYTKGNNATGGWTGDASLGIGIEAGRHDTQDNDFATGIDQCLNKDGSNAATGNLNLGGFIPTNIGAGTAAAPALCAGGDVNTGIFSAAVDQIGIATNGTERVRIDASGKVGIGTTAPAQAFHVSDGTSSGDVRMVLGDATNNVLLIRNGASDGWIRFSGVDGIVDVTGAKNLLMRTNGAERMRITSAGNVGVGGTPASNVRLMSQGATADSTGFSFATQNSTPTASFWVRNDGMINTGVLPASPWNNALGLGANVYVGSDGQLYKATSSIKYKTDVIDYDKGLEDLLLLRSVYYKDKKEPLRQYAGLIAEEVLEAGMPEFVQFSNDNTPDGLSYGHMMSLAVNSIKELNAKVEALETRVAELEA